METPDGQEPKNIELSYFINCNTVKESGMLTINVNERMVYSDTIFCQYANKREIPLDASYFRINGANDVEFMIDKGDYNLDQVKITSTMKTKGYPKYTFEVGTDLWEDIVTGKKKAYIKFLFNEGGKKANIRVQEDQFNIDTRSTIYTKDITSSLDNGANHVTIIPLNAFEIKSMKIFVE